MPFIDPKLRGRYFMNLKKNGRYPGHTEHHRPSFTYQTNSGQTPWHGSTPIYQAQPTRSVQPMPQPCTMPPMTPPSLQFHQVTPEQQFAQFQQFQAQSHERSYAQFQSFLMAQRTPPMALQSATHMPNYPQTPAQYGSPYYQPDQSVHPHVSPHPYHQPGLGPFNQGAPAHVHSTGCCVGHGATTPCCSSTSTPPTPRSSPNVEAPLKRKPADSISEVTKPKKPKHGSTTETILPKPDHMNLPTKPNLESTSKHVLPSAPMHVGRNVKSTTFQSNPTNPQSADPDASEAASSNSTVKPSNTNNPQMLKSTAKPTLPSTPMNVLPKLNVDAPNSKSSSLDHDSPSLCESATSCSTLKDDTPLTHCGPLQQTSKEDLNTIALDYNIDLAVSFLDQPDHKEGILLADYVIVHKELFSDMRSHGWYSMQTFFSWRASIEIPRNWIIVIHDEDAKSHPISADTTDIIKVCLESNRAHWTLVHLSVKNWIVTYYDSFLGSATKEDDEMHMTLSCSLFLYSVRFEHPSHGATLPARDPHISSDCTIRQIDSFSCGPLALREAERLMGFKVYDDEECPTAMRCRHVKTIFKAVNRHIQKLGGTPPSTAKHGSPDFEETSASSISQPGHAVTTNNALSPVKIASSTSTPTQEPQPSATTDAAKPKSVSQATTACSTPPQSTSALVPVVNEQHYNSMIHNNEYLPQSLLTDSPISPPEDGMIDDTLTPPPLQENDTDFEGSLPILDSIEAIPAQDPIMLERAFYQNQLLSTIDKGLAYLRNSVQPDHSFRLNGQDVDAAILQCFQLGGSYDEKVMGLLVATSGHRDDWVCVLQDVEVRRLPPKVQNIIYLVYRKRWLLVHVNLASRVLTLYASDLDKLKTGQEFIEEVHYLHRGKKKQAMSVKTANFFGDEPVVNFQMACDGGGVIAWWQAEILLGLIEEHPSQSIHEARLRHVNQVVAEMHAKSVPRQRAKQTSYKAMMPPNNSDDPDDSGDFDALCCSPVTLQDSCAEDEDDHDHESTSMPPDSKRNLSVAVKYGDPAFPIKASYKGGELIVLNDKDERLLYCSRCLSVMPLACFTRGPNTFCDSCHPKKAVTTKNPAGVTLRHPTISLWAFNGIPVQWCSHCTNAKPPSSFSEGYVSCDQCLVKENPNRKRKRNFPLQKFPGVFKVTDFKNMDKNVKAIGPEGESGLRYCHLCSRFQYFHQFQTDARKGTLLTRCIRCRNRICNLQTPVPDVGEVYFGKSEVLLYDNEGNLMQLCSNCLYVKTMGPMGGFSKGKSECCDQCIEVRLRTIDEQIAEATGLGKKYCVPGRHIAEPEEFANDTARGCMACNSLKRPTNEGRTGKRVCTGCGEFKEHVDFAYRDRGACTYCAYGGPPPSTVGRRQVLDLDYERIGTSFLSEFCARRLVPMSNKATRPVLISALSLYDTNLRLAEIETKAFRPVSIGAVDLLVVMTRKSNQMTPEQKAEARLLNEQSTAHLIANYLSGTPPLKSIPLEYPMPATDGAVDLFKKLTKGENKDGETIARLLDELAPGCSAVFLLHGRDGLTVTNDEWLRFGERWPYLQKTLVISEHMTRISTEVLTGWVDGTPERVWCLFDINRVIDNLLDRASDVVYRRLIDKWARQYGRRVMQREANKMEGGKTSGRNQVRETCGINFGKHNPKSLVNRRKAQNA